jgi:prepilin-type N-terminal cleavage/methylation domain-containing protein
MKLIVGSANSFFKIQITQEENIDMMYIKQKKVLHQYHFSRKTKNGFTLIEILVSLSLILLSALMGARVMASAIGSYKKSRAGFSLLQKTESFKHQLLSQPFDSEDWQNGSFQKQEVGFGFEWKIKPISSSLKIAELSIKDKANQFARYTYFYKSKYIKNIKRATLEEE